MRLLQLALMTLMLGICPVDEILALILLIAHFLFEVKAYYFVLPGKKNKGG